MKTLLTVAVTLLALVVLAAGYVWSGTYDVGADAPHSRAVHAVLESMRERSIGTHSAGIAPPDLANEQLISSGAGNYDAMCAGCHLAPGIEETELSRGLYPRPPNLSQTVIDNPAEAFWAIKHGIKASGMPAWGKSMGDDYIWGMVAFLRQLPDLDVKDYAAAVAASGGHSHGGGESGSTAAAMPEHEHEGAGHEARAEPAGHTHADGKQHVHATAPATPVDTARLFHQALAAGDRDKVQALLDPKVLVLESGGAERSLAEYAAHHLGADLQFLRTVRSKLQRQSVNTVGDLAWVASESRLTGTTSNRPVDLLSTETLVLQRTSGSWKVVHVHWSSRPAGEQ
ncbi:MAG TPA: c-type cytochrome [Steroidobacteraceae bacterium]|nr:c-type cytochrome [Steroidobacteraceae bacterium]